MTRFFGVLVKKETIGELNGSVEKVLKVDKHLKIMYAITTFKRISMVDFKIICTLCAGEVGKPRLFMYL